MAKLVTQVAPLSRRGETLSMRTVRETLVNTIGATSHRVQEIGVEAMTRRERAASRQGRGVRPRPPRGVECRRVTKTWASPPSHQIPEMSPPDLSLRLPPASWAGASAVCRSIDRRARVWSGGMLLLGDQPGDLADRVEVLDAGLVGLDGDAEVVFEERRPA